MRVTILTHWPNPVIEILDQQFENFLPHHLLKSEIRFELKLAFEDDTEYRDWQGWGADALACGLVFGFQVER